jgi:hypothetical protein
MKSLNGAPGLVALHRRWRLWTAMVGALARSRTPRCVDPREYETAHRELLQACGALAETADESRRPFYRDLQELVQPWLTPLVLQLTDRAILTDLLDRCQQVGRQLGGRGWGDVARRGAAWGLVALAAAGVGFVLWQADWLRESVAEHAQGLWRQLRWALHQSGDGERWLIGGVAAAVLAVLLVWWSARS